MARKKPELWISLSRFFPAMSAWRLRASVLWIKTCIPAGKNLNFYVLHKRHRLKILLSEARPYRVGLLDGEPFQEPPVLLSGERTYFGRVPGPLETSAVEPFV